MKPKKKKPSIRWEPVSKKPSKKHTHHTLVKVVGWNRFGFATFYPHGWRLSKDPAAMDEAEKERQVITHWLAVPKSHESN